MFYRLLRTDKDISLTIMRLILGSIFLAHGSQKLLGLWGGLGFFGTLDAFHQNGIPIFLGILVIACEFLGGLGLILGFLTRLWAVGIGAIMSVAIWMVHWPHGLFMNWFGNQKGEGFEFHLLAIAICITLLIKGAGLFSIDRTIAK